MNAETTFVRRTRPAAPPADGAGVQLAGLLLSLPLRLLATAFGRRLAAAVAVSAVLLALVTLMYQHADAPGRTAAPAAARLPRQTRTAAAVPVPRRLAAPAVTRADSAAAAAAAWFAKRLNLAADQVQTLQQRHLSATETRVLVMAQASGGRMPSAYVTVRHGPDGWKVA